MIPVIFQRSMPPPNYHCSRVYCKFHYMEYQSFNNSEEELLYFVRSFSNTTWKWTNQYEADLLQDDQDEEHRTYNILFPFYFFYSF